MEFFELISARRSIRAFVDKPVSDAQLKQILEAANAAPSAGNLQAYEIFVIKSEKTKRILADAAFGQEFVAEAPVVLVFCANPTRSSLKYGSRGSQLYCVQDATIACAYAQLAVAALGLGSVWVGAFDEAQVARALGTSGTSLRPVAILPIGWPAEHPQRTPRRRLSELVHEKND